MALLAISAALLMLSSGSRAAPGEPLKCPGGCESVPTHQIIASPAPGRTHFARSATHCMTSCLGKGDRFYQFNLAGGKGSCTCFSSCTSLAPAPTNTVRRRAANGTLSTVAVREQYVLGLASACPPSACPVGQCKTGPAWVFVDKPEAALVSTQRTVEACQLVCHRADAGYTIYQWAQTGRCECFKHCKEVQFKRGLPTAYFIGCLPTCFPKPAKTRGGKGKGLTLPTLLPAKTNGAALPKATATAGTAKTAPQK